MSKSLIAISRLTAGTWGVKARTLLRRHPRLKDLAQRLLLRSGAAAYEERFHAALMQAIRPGDVVWDVGANVGHYTSIFAQAVGPAGAVIAFEPSPGCRPALATIAEDYPNVRVLEIALSDYDGWANFDTSRGETDVNNQLRKDGDVEVRVARADSVLSAGTTQAPDIVKIDVEGFEPEVLAGFGGSLTVPRAFMVEVHFGQLALRGLAAYPAQLPSLFQGRGFTVGWVDPSHLVATRETRPL